MVSMGPWGATGDEWTGWTRSQSKLIRNNNTMIRDNLDCPSSQSSDWSIRRHKDGHFEKNLCKNRELVAGSVIVWIVGVQVWHQIGEELLYQGLDLGKDRVRDKSKNCYLCVKICLFSPLMLPTFILSVRSVWNNPSTLSFSDLINQMRP